MIEYLDETAITWDRGGRPKSARQMPETITQTAQQWINGSKNTIIKMTTESVILGADPEDEDYRLTSGLAALMLQDPEIWYLTDAACEIVKEAAKTLPKDMVPVPNEYTEGKHFIWFETPYILPNVREGVLQVQAIDAISTMCGYGGRASAHGVIQLNGYSWDSGKLVPQRISWWELKDSWFQEDKNAANHNHMRAMLHATMSLVSAKEIMHSEPATEGANRAEVRRAERIGIPLDGIKVIYLGARRRETDGPTGEGTKMTTRFIVSGHWRKQPCGPGKQYTKTIWISPHIKGPEDAPLVISKTVKVVTP
jgi:hypothetical protein